MSLIEVVECSRDAMQGIKNWIPSKDKISYLQSVLSVGFDVVDFGSFVSPTAIPQLRDTGYVLDNLDLSLTKSKLLAIVANVRGAKDACSFSQIDYLGYPFSISENFQMRNTNKSIKESIIELESIINLTEIHNKNIVVYLSMGFGNPYGDYWNYEIVESWIDLLSQMNIKNISLSDTIGSAKESDILQIFSNSVLKYPEIEFGAHFHTKPDQWYNKINAAYSSGCRVFDGAIQGFGGCPMAKDDLTGNFPTEKIITYFNSKKISLNINSLNFESCYNNASKLFNKFKS
jgi:hydroxymethylglutaryl-CoA lyase